MNPPGHGGGMSAGDHAPEQASSSAASSSAQQPQGAPGSQAPAEPGSSGARLQLGASHTGPQEAAARATAQSECEFVSGLRSQAFRVVASQPWARGQEVFINYGSSSNDALMQLYGFVQEDNPDDRYIVRTLPGALSKLGLAGDSTSSDTNTLAEVVFTRQGLDAAAAAQLLRLIPGDAAVLPDASGSVPFAVLSSGAKAVCAGAVEQELSALAVDADRDAEVLQAFEQLPAKHAELASKQADLAQANSRLDQLQQMLQAQDSEQLEAEEQQQQVAELVATRQLCEDVCQRVSAEVSGLEAVTARWQQLAEAGNRVAHMAGRAEQVMKGLQLLAQHLRKHPPLERPGGMHPALAARIAAARRPPPPPPRGGGGYPPMPGYGYGYGYEPPPAAYGYGY